MACAERDALSRLNEKDHEGEMRLEKNEHMIRSLKNPTGDAKQIQS